MIAVSISTVATVVTVLCINGCVDGTREYKSASLTHSFSIDITIEDGGGNLFHLFFGRTNKAPKRIS